MQLAGDAFDVWATGFPLQLDTYLWSLETLRGLRNAAGGLAVLHTNTIIYTFSLITLVVVLQVVTRRRWAMIALMTVLIYLLEVGTGDILRALPTFVPIIAAHLVVFFRFGMLPLVIGMTINSLSQELPLTAHLNAWYSTPTWLYLALIAVLTIWGIRTAAAPATGEPS
jgi:hypothetical protein